jgi:hypothetical protein
LSIRVKHANNRAAPCLRRTLDNCMPEMCLYSISVQPSPFILFHDLPTILGLVSSLPQGAESTIKQSVPDVCSDIQTPCSRSGTLIWGDWKGGVYERGGSQCSVRTSDGSKQSEVARAPNRALFCFCRFTKTAGNAHLAAYFPMITWAIFSGEPSGGYLTHCQIVLCYASKGMIFNICLSANLLEIWTWLG